MTVTAPPPEVPSEQPRDEESRVTRLGAGSFASVYTVEGRAFRALKLVADVERTQELKDEFKHLQNIYKRCHNQENFFWLPKPYVLHESIHQYAEKACFSAKGFPDHAMYAMERVWPVPEGLSQKIRDLYFPASQQQSLKYKTFLARLYLGKQPRATSSSSSRFFNHLNFPLSTDMVEQLGLPAANIAAGMGRMLSSIHYLGGLDGRDIEFVLGGDTDTEPGEEAFKPKYYCIDFNQMRQWQSVQQLVDSFTINDPYYPRPGMKYWDEFKEAYIDEATVSARNTAQEFVSAIERWAEEKRSTQAGGSK